MTEAQMLKKKVTTDEPLKVTVGDVTFHILRIGARHVTLGIDAPKDIPIQMPGGKSTPDGCCDCDTGCDTD